VRHHLPALHAALRAGRVLLLDPDPPFYWATGCPHGAAAEGRWECHFQPLSRTCPHAAVADLVAAGRLTASTVAIPRYWWSDALVPHATAAGAADVVTLTPGRNRHFYHTLFPAVPGAAPRGLFATLLPDGATPPAPRGDGGASGERGAAGTAPPAPAPLWAGLPPAAARRAWLVGAVHFLTRLHARAAADVRAVLASSALAACPAGECLVGVPLRASDKCYGAHPEMVCVTLPAALDAAARLAFAQPTITGVVLTCEDAAAIAPAAVARALAAVAPWAPPLAVHRNAADDAPPGSGAGRPAARRDGSVPSVGEVAAAALGSLHLQAGAAYHVLAPRSTYGSWVSAAAKATPGKAADVVFPLGDGHGLKNSLKDQM